MNWRDPLNQAFPNVFKIPELFEMLSKCLFTFLFTVKKNEPKLYL